MRSALVLTPYLVSVGILAFFSSAQAGPTWTTKGDENQDDNKIELHFHVEESPGYDPNPKQTSHDYQSGKIW